MHDSCMQNARLVHCDVQTKTETRARAQSARRQNAFCQPSHDPPPPGTRRVINDGGGPGIFVNNVIQNCLSLNTGVQYT